MTAATLAKHAPAEYADFRVAFEEFVAFEMESSTRAPTSEAQRQLGYTQALIQLRNMLLYSLEDVITKPPMAAKVR